MLYTSDNNPIDCDKKFAKTRGMWTKTYDSKDKEQKDNPAKWKCQGPFVYDAGHAAYLGNWVDQYDMVGSWGGCEL